MIPKFRAWIKSRKRFEQVQHLMWHKEELTRVITSHECVIHTNLPEDVIILQSTGLFDFYAKEIFDGDFIQDQNGVTYLVRYVEERGRWEFVDAEDEFRHLPILFENIEEWRVFGNIHEHPHLVEVGG